MPTGISGASVVCTGSTIILTCATPGGTWSVSTTAIATINPATGELGGIVPGVDGIQYTLGGGCSSTTTVTVGAATVPISGTTTACVGYTSSLSDAVGGGTWMSSDPSIASVDASGIVTANSAGTATISYTATSSCGSGTVTVLFTADATPGSISGPSSVCVGGTITDVCSPTGGFWTCSSVATLTLSFLGAITGVTPGTAVITYSTSTGCTTTATITVTAALPAVSILVSLGVCNGGIDTLLATCAGASSYSWSPTAGLSCSTCEVTMSATSDTSTFTVVASDGSGCTSTGSVTLDGNRIKGHINYTVVTPTALDTKVWLIQYNPADSSLTAMDSLVTCVDGFVPYYQFNDKPAGDYLIKAKLMSSITGTSDYIPTYGLSNPHWDTATTIVHGSGANTQDINMIYGTVPSGPGFIGGLIVMGAGKGTSGEVPAPNILVYLEDGSGNILTYTYTDLSGAYSFSGIGLGSYIIYPTDYKYRTTPSPVLTLTGTATSITAADFKKHTTLGTITPFIIVTGVNHLAGANELTLSPNPAGNTIMLNWKAQATGSAVVTFTDMTGRTVFNTSVDMATASGNISLQPNLPNGQYFVRISGTSVNWTGRITIAK